MQDKMAYLERAHAAGVLNIEMEVQYFGMLTHHTGYRAAALCVTLLVRSLCHGENLCVCVCRPLHLAPRG
jgi:uridine phosphorylase